MTTSLNLGEVGYIDANNVFHLNQKGLENYNLIKSYTLGTSGITIAQAVAGQDLSEWNKPQQYSWSFSNLLQNAGSIDNGITKYILIGAATLIAVAALK